MQKVGLAEQPVDIVVARNDHDLVPVEAEVFRQRDEEVVHLVELALVTGLGQVAGDHDEVRPQAVDLGPVPQIVVQPAEQRPVGTVGLGQPGPAEHMVRSELGVGDVQHRDGRLRGRGEPARRGADRGRLTEGCRLVIRPRECGWCGRAGEQRGDGGLGPAFDGRGDPREQCVGGGRLVMADQIDVGG